MYDVIVIGGGPAGSLTASRLAALGYEVAVLEQKPSPDGKLSCTGIIGMECVTSFSIDSSVILRQVGSARLYSPAGVMLRVHRDEPQAAIVDRTACDTLLAHRAQAKGAQYFFSMDARTVHTHEHHVSVTATHQQEEKAFEARALVIASGFGGALTVQLGIDNYADFVAGAQAEVSAGGLEEVEVYFGSNAARGFFGWLVPTSQGKARVGLLSRKSPTTYLRELLASLHRQAKIDSPDVEIHAGGIPLKPLQRTFGDRFVVVGDAAGQVKPTTGGGIYYGLIGAELAAEALHHAFTKGDLSAQSLSSYERTWKRKLGRELRTGYWARRLFERLNDDQLDRIFKTMRDKGIDEKLSRQADLSFDWHSKAIRSLLDYDILSGIIRAVLPLKLH